MSAYEVNVHKSKATGAYYTIMMSDMFGRFWWYDENGKGLHEGSINDENRTLPLFLEEPMEQVRIEEWPSIALDIVAMLLRAGHRCYCDQHQWKPQRTFYFALQKESSKDGCDLIEVWEETDTGRILNEQMSWQQYKSDDDEADDNPKAGTSR